MLLQIILIFYIPGECYTDWLHQLQRPVRVDEKPVTAEIDVSNDGIYLLILVTQCFPIYVMSEVGYFAIFLSHLPQNMPELPPQSYFLL